MMNNDRAFNVGGAIGAKQNKSRVKYQTALSNYTQVMMLGVSD